MKMLESLVTVYIYIYISVFVLKKIIKKIKRSIEYKKTYINYTFLCYAKMYS